METTKAIKTRRSTRSYLPKKVARKTIEELIELANLAPTASNLENRRFILIQDKETIKKIYELGFKQSHLLEAPVIIAVATDTKLCKAREFLEKNEEWGTDLWGVTARDYETNKRFKLHWKRWSSLWPVQDADAAVTTLLLAAVAKGLDACWVGLFDFKKVKKVLRLPKSHEVIALVTLGYRKKSPYPQKRKPAKDLLHWEKW